MCKDVNYCSSTVNWSPQLGNLNSIFRFKIPKSRYIKFVLLVFFNNISRSLEVYVPTLDHEAQAIVVQGKIGSF